MNLGKMPNNKDISFDSMDRLRDEYGENYPANLDLHPDSEEHQALLQLIMTAVKSSHDVISQRFPVWKELDQKLSVYVDLSKEEKELKRKDESKPVSIVVPIAYATRETLLTYWAAAFLQSPLFRYVPSRDPKDTLGVLLLENIVEQQAIRQKAALELNTMWSDAFTYGLGATLQSWEKIMGLRTVRKTEFDKILGFPYRPRKQKAQEPFTKYEGNTITALDPYNIFPDLNFPIVKTRSMGFFGWVERTTYNDLLLEEKDEGELFNVRFLSNLKDCKSNYYSATDQKSGRYSKQGIPSDMPQTDAVKPADRITMYMSIIPEEFGLGEGRYPEWWKFIVTGDRIIIGASPSGLDHNQIPVATMSPDSDGHTTLPVSILEREYPLQHAIDWLWQSHVANVRKVINNMIVADPSRINMNDLVDTKFGMVARLRAAAWGSPVEDAIMQLNVQDVTQNHISDIGFLMGIDNLVFTSSQAKGVQERQGERVSAQEAKDTRMSFLSKMERQAKIGAIQAHYDIAEQFASNTIQLLEEDQYVRITGEYEQRLKEEFGIANRHLKVKPEALDVRYDVVPQDGTIPGGEYADVWERLMATAASHPELYKKLDFVRVWKHVARLLGARNVDDFMKKGMESKVMRSENIQEEARKGNMASISDLEATA